MNELSALWRPHLAAVAAVMNNVLRVRWDRAIEGVEVLHLYGWVDRPDGRADFVMLGVEWRHRAGDGQPFELFTMTSSADPALNDELAKAIGVEPDDHADCQRIEEVFGGMVTNAIKLGR